MPFSLRFLEPTGVRLLRSTHAVALLAAVALCAAVPQSARAGGSSPIMDVPHSDNPRGDFWDADDMSDPWKPVPAMQPKAEIQYFVPAKAVVKEEPKVEVKRPTDPKAIDADPNMTDEEKILAKYGNPDDKPAITPIDSAPKPFKGMIEAINAGDEKLAYRFAKQYVRMTHQLAQIGGHVGSLVNVAKLGEGVENDDTGTLRARSSVSDLELLDEDLRRQHEAQPEMEEDSGAAAKLDDKVRSLFKKASRETNGAAADAEEEGAAVINKPQPAAPQKPEAPIDERVERQKVRAKYAGTLPVDPKGQVQMYFFLKPIDPQAMKMAPQIQTVANTFAKDPRVKIIGFTLGQAMGAQVARFRQATGASFPIVDGSAMAQMLQLSVSPTVVLVSPSTGQSFTEFGVRPAYYLEEMVKLMQGKGVK